MLLHQFQLRRQQTEPDNLSHTMLKLVKQSIAKPLTLLFTRSLNEGSYPQNWKIAHVISIFKKSDKTDASNYRSVSLLTEVRFQNDNSIALT